MVLAATAPVTVWAVPDPADRGPAVADAENDRATTAGPAVADARATAVDPDDARLTVTDVAVSPTTPTTAGPVTFEVTLRNSVGSVSSVQLESLSVRTEDGEALRSVTNLGTLSAGDTLTVPVTARFAEPGEKRLTLVAVGTDEDDETVRVSRPVSVAIERAPPQLDVAPAGGVAGARTSVPVTVSNPTEEPMRNLTVTVDGTSLVPVDARETVPVLAAGGSTTVNLSVRPTAAGDATLQVGVTYTTASGVLDRTVVDRSLRVAPLEDDVGVSVTPDREPDTQQVPQGIQGVLAGAGGQATTQQDDGEQRSDRVAVTVTNFGNAPVAGVVVGPRVEDRRLARQSVADRLAPGESTTVTVDLSTVRRPGEIAFEVSYLTAGQEGEATTTYDYRPETGAVRLTGLELALEDGRLVLSGNAGNVGDADLEGMVVELGENEHVEPAYPNRNYFVGTVEASEFAPFELTADVDAENVSSIPVRVSYRVDGYEFERTVSVPYEGVSPDDTETSGGLPWIPALAGVVVLALAGAGYGIWRGREE